MRVVIQRVASAGVVVEGKRVAEIGQGAMCLCGLGTNDTEDDLKWMANKVLSCRLWPNAAGKPWAESCKTMSLPLLLVSQFTLHAVMKGNKPDFHRSMPPGAASKLFETFCSLVKNQHPTEAVETGVFGAKMQVDLINDGPVTLVFDTDTVNIKRKLPRPNLSNSKGKDRKVSPSSGTCVSTETGDKTEEKSSKIQ